MRLATLCRAGATSLALLVATVLAPAAGSVELSNLSVAFDPGNTANLYDDAGTEGRQITSTVGVLSSSATTLTTRYQAGVYTDAGGNGAVTTVITLNAAYTISFDVVNAAGSVWQLDIDTSRVGARTSVTDGAGQSAFSLSAVTGFLGGAGSISSGSLGLAAIGRTQQGNSVNLAFNQLGTATVDGTGNGSVTLTFLFSATAETIVQGNQGDEAAIRMGIPENLTSFTAGEYPGVGNRPPANDGHFVSLTLFDLGPIPEPDTALMLGLGLLLIGGWRRHTRRPGRRPL